MEVQPVSFMPTFSVKVTSAADPCKGLGVGEPQLSLL